MTKSEQNITQSLLVHYSHEKGYTDNRDTGSANGSTFNISNYLNHINALVLFTNAVFPHSDLTENPQTYTVS